MDSKELNLNALEKVSGGQSIYDVYPGGEAALRKKIRELKAKGVTFDQFCSMAMISGILEMFPEMKEKLRQFWESC